ncbi:MAG: hypothetical protein M1434_13430 [Chloroflexi bacterium]|nr:hypothetical protein [Chloroflexota bacterium]MCL5275724.1 hypothetical protein [Chloroflexota bacterium]
MRYQRPFDAGAFASSVLAGATASVGVDFLARGVFVARPGVWVRVAVLFFADVVFLAGLLEFLAGVDFGSSADSLVVFLGMWFGFYHVNVFSMLEQAIGGNGCI